MAKMIRKDLEAKLAALNGAEWDSMSDDSMGDEVTPEDIDVVVEGDGGDDEEVNDPPIPLRRGFKKTEKHVGKKVTASVVPLGPAGEPSGVIYIGHIPHGFYEEAMNGFFRQFGDVVRLRVSRSKKSARCKGYAFVEFSSPEVAGIVAETMDGYRLCGKQLVCRVLKYDEIHRTLFDGAGVKFKKINWHSLYRKRFNADRTPDEDKKRVGKLLARDRARRKKLAALGIDYDFPGFAASLKDRRVAEVPSEQPETEKGEGSDSKKRNGEKIASPTVKTSPDEYEEPSSVPKKSKTGIGATPVNGGPEATKHPNPVSVTSSKTRSPSRATERISKTSPPPETTRVESKVSAAAKTKASDRKPAFVGRPAVGEKMEGGCANGVGGESGKNPRTNTPLKVKVESDGVLKTPVSAGLSKRKKKTEEASSSSEGRGSIMKSNTPRKVNEGSRVPSKSPVSGEPGGVEGKGSTRSGPSTEQKNSKIPLFTCGGDSSSTAVGSTETQSSGGIMANPPKRTKKLTQQGKTEACLSQATLPTGSKLPKRNKRSRS